MKDTVTGRAFLVRGGDRPDCRVVVVSVRRERAVGRLVKVQIGWFNLPIGVTGLVRNNLEDIGATIPATQGRKPPVGGHTSNHRVVSVKGVILGANQFLGNGTSKKNGEDLVRDWIGFCLIERKNDERLIPEGGVFELRNEIQFPGSSESDVGVVAIIGHIGGDESPLRKSATNDIGFKAGKILDLSKSGCIAGNAVKEDQRVMFTNVVVGEGFLVGIVVTLEAGIWDLFLIFPPRNAFSVQQVSNGRDIGRNLVEVIVIHAEVVTPGGGTIIGLGGVSGSPVIGQRNSLFGQDLLVGVTSRSTVVL